MHDEAANSDPSVAQSNQAEFNRGLRAEVAAWRDEGLISGQQARSILARYPEYVPAASNPLGLRVISVMAIMGAVLIGLGIIAAVAANWSAIPALAKVALMAIGTPVLYVIGWVLAYRLPYPRIGLAIILSGTIAYGASVHLIAQTYHVPVNHPNLVAVWFVGVVPLAYIARSKSVLALALALLVAAAGFRSQEWFPDFDEEGLFFMPALYLALAAALMGLGPWQKHSRYTAPFSTIYVTSGLVLSVAAIYAMSFDGFWSAVARDHLDRVALVWPRLECWVVMGAAGAVAAGSTLAGLHRSRSSTGEEIWWGSAAVGSAAIVVVIALTALALDIGWIWWVFNLLMLAAVIGMVAAGYRLAQPHLINFAVAVFAITVFTRYFEFGFGLLGQSLAFIVTGVLLLAVGFGLELLRRRMLQRIRMQAAS